MTLVGHVDEISRSRVVGWVVDTDRPDDIISVSILVNGAHRGMCVTTHARDDVMLPDGRPATGKCAFYFAFEPPLSPFVEQRIDVIETWAARPLRNGSRVLPRPALTVGDPAARTPILVTSTGRTGTTLLMSAFARHPDIVVGDHFPYEIKQIAYHAAAFRALAADADRERSTTPETMLAPEMSRIIGSNPYNVAGYFGLGGERNALRDFYQSVVPSGLATLFRDFIVKFYDTLAKSQGKAGASFFSEKGDIDSAAVEGARLFFDSVRDIVIVRDPRDLLCSAVSFWKLRPETAMSMLTTTIPRLARIAREAGPDTVVVRYEDLVRDAAATWRVLSDFLDLDMTIPGSNETIPDSHRTSRDPAASIGRWRTDLTEAQAAACELAFGPYMHDFGYAVTRANGGRARGGNGGRKHEAHVPVAEGPLAVGVYQDNAAMPAPDGTVARLILEVPFGREGVAAAFTLDGWSTPERGFVWSSATLARLRLPAIRRSGSYRLRIVVAPFTHGTDLPSQRVSVRLNELPATTVRARDICILELPVPAGVADSGEPITVTFRFPDATRPSALMRSNDDRELGFSLHTVSLCRMEATTDQATPDPRRPGPPGPKRADTTARGDDEQIVRLTDVLRRSFRAPELCFSRRKKIAAIPEFTTAGLIRLILTVEAEFDVHLHEDAVDGIVTMGDLAALLRARTATAG